MRQRPHSFRETAAFTQSGRPPPPRPPRAPRPRRPRPPRAGLAGNGSRRGGAGTGMWVGLIAIVVALAAAAVLGVLQRRARFRRAAPDTAGVALAEADLGAPLGERATLVQFSTAFCAPCRSARQVLGRVAETVGGVEHVEIDATARMDLVRQFKITSTPTVLILGPKGTVARRATGVPQAGAVIAALGEVASLELSSKSADNDR
jgi:thiol-disulfide isomerase/thioredoxin